jgi:salicylate hydroxylase
VRFNCQVETIDPKARKVKLASGEILSANVIIGADGVSGLCRSLVGDGDLPSPVRKCNMYRWAFILPHSYTGSNGLQ